MYPYAIFGGRFDYGRRGREPLSDPEITRREVIARVASGEYKTSASFMKSPTLAVDDIYRRDFW